MEAILKDERFNASIHNVKRIVDDLYFELSREIPNTRRSLKDLIKDCKRVLKLKVNDK
ncbi:hypothetical protein [Campylobacter coli]|uniref:hypothetical protein n=1 Tax=Campylobacter coli TaxID=195 RepID=UPI004034A034